MSYYARSTASTIWIDRKHFSSILLDAGLNPNSPGPGVDDMVAKWLSEAGFTADFDNAGNIDSVWYEYGKYDSDDVGSVFRIIAPYIESGCNISFVGQEDEQWAYFFDGKTFAECYGITVFPEIPGDAGAALHGVKDAHQYLYEIFAEQADQLDPTIEQEIEFLRNRGDNVAVAARTVLLQRMANSQPSDKFLTYADGIEQML